MTTARIDTAAIRRRPVLVPDQVARLCDEVDRLRAENELLTAENQRLMEAARP